MSNPKIYAPSGQNILNVIESTNVGKRFVEPFVIEQFKQFHTISKIASVLGSPEATKSGKRKVEIPQQGNTYPVAAIAQRSLSGVILTLTWSDPQATPFRLDEAVEFESGTVAICNGTIEGTATFLHQSSVDGSTSFAATDAVAGEEVSSRGVQVKQGSTKIGTERKIAEFAMNYNYIPETVETGAFNYAEVTEDDITYLEKGYFVHAQVYGAMQRAAESFAVNQYASQRSYKNDIYMAAGFEQQIGLGGGVVDYYTGDLSENVLTSFIDKLKANGGGSSKFAVVAGYDVIGMFQRFAGRNLLLATGVNNTIGGKEVKGIDVFHFAYNGIQIEMIEEPMFTNQNMFTVSSASSVANRQARKMFWFSLDNVTLANGKGTVPFLKSYKYGEMGMEMMVFQGIINKDGALDIKNAKTESKETRVHMMYNKMFQLMNASQCGVLIGN
jgi:hypothetical protein